MQKTRYNATGSHPSAFQTPESVAISVTTKPIALLTTIAVIIARIGFSDAGTFLANHNKMLSKINVVPKSCDIKAPAGLSSNPKTEPNFTGNKTKPIPNTITTIALETIQQLSFIINPPFRLFDKKIT